MTETFSRWLLTGGFPPEPDSGSWDDIASTPGPLSLLDAVFLNFAKISVHDMPSREDDDALHVDGDWQTRQVTVEKAGVGYRLKVDKCIETSAIAPTLRLETFGLPGLTIDWQYRLELAGQLGHAAFRHTRLAATFDGPDRKAAFEAIWKDVYGVKPEFDPA